MISWKSCKDGRYKNVSKERVDKMKKDKKVHKSKSRSRGKKLKQEYSEKEIADMIDNGVFDDLILRDIEKDTRLDLRGIKIHATRCKRK
jgi:hypothetical protein